MTVSISHQAIVSQVKACVALENLVHAEMKGMPLLTANGEALDAVVRGALLNIAASLGDRVTDISQSDTHTTISLRSGSADLRNLLEQAATASVLQQCFSTVAQPLSSHYGDCLDSLCGKLATAGAAGVRIREYPF